MQRMLILGLAALLTACGGGDDRSPLDSVGEGTPPAVPTPPPVSFDVSVVNLTNAQPLSPVAMVLHNGGVRVFEVGSPVNLDLENLAEGGDNGPWLASFDGNADVLETRSGAGPLPPGGRQDDTFELADDDIGTVHLSVVSMLVNTNDAITSVNAVDLSGMMVGDSMTLNLVAYDAGTEADTEAPGTIPGPADGGEGFNAVRDDELDGVTMHNGVISNSDVLATSVLTEQHRFDNPVARVIISRTQ